MLTIAELLSLQQRYFENPFSSYNFSIPSPINAGEYLEEAAKLIKDINHHYGGIGVIQNLQNAETDIYTGISGIGYACYRLLSTPAIKEDDRRIILDLGNRIFDTALGKKSRRENGILIGDAGVFVAAALFFNAAGKHSKVEDSLREFAKSCVDVDQLKVRDSSGDELFAGRIGYLAGFLELWKIFPDHPTLLQIKLVKIIKAIILSGKEYARKRGLHPEQESPLFFYHYGSDYLGAAHGISTILQFLLCFPQLLSHSDLQDVKKSVDYTLRWQTSSGNFPPQFGEREERDALVHWCHGASGVIYMLAKAYIVWKDAKYLEAAQACTDLIWKKGLLRKGPGICHGIAGSGYAFLLMYRLTGKEEYLYQAQCFADLMFHPSVRGKSRTPDNPYSLFEGIAGSVCFLTDLTAPMKASFPFCDIFTDFTVVK